MTKNLRKVYIDYNATTPLRAEVKTLIIEDLENFGNASSMHALGRFARAKVEQARAQVGALINADPSEISGSIVFTSGGSEANNMVFQTMYRLVACSNCRQGKSFGAHKTDVQNRNEILTTSIEHPCVLNSALNIEETGLKVKILPVDENGKLKIDALKNALSDKTLFVSVMAANNEIGVIQNIKEITALVKNAGAFMHTDAVQAAGKIPINVKDWGVDYLTLSAHKIYGPKGVGALYVKKGVPLFPLIHGGHQENSLRAGTYNNTGIFGFGKAAELAAAEIDKYNSAITPLRDKLRAGLEANIPNITINGGNTDTLPNTLNISFPGAEGEAILLSMDMQGIQASTGSACASGSLEPSHVLSAIGLGPELSHGSIRFSLGWGITEDDINYIIETLPPIIARLRSMSTIT
ncbi:MAG: aminotransferase class V-fold PLP-dependent enzyme [Treponema sp.]|jgi:cysteine desulfurase|nr:aminotransferase class V-fold PLP-dependent enzyme [Treponema sp.]